MASFDRGVERALAERLVFVSGVLARRVRPAGRSGGDDMILLALDPGPAWCGYAIARLDGPRASYMSGGKVASKLEALQPLVGVVDAVAVESPKGHVFDLKRGAMLIATSRIAGGIAWLTLSRGVRLVEFSAQEVRSMLCGRASAGDHAVADVVRANVAGLPKRTNEHMRDACALAVVAAWKLHAERRRAS